MDTAPFNIEAYLRKHLKFNIGVSLADAAFFGTGWGFSSFGTVIPLFVSQFTESAILVGLIPAIHAVGWQLPQLFTANRVARLRRYKPMLMMMTIHERVPFLGIALVAWMSGELGPGLSLLLIYLLLIWQGLGSGLSANPWQSMIAKIIPSDARGTFFGLQAAVANSMIFFAAIGAGYLLDLLDGPLDFALCFLVAAVAYGLSMFFLAFTREPSDDQRELPPDTPSPFKGMSEILRRDPNFAWFMVFRVLFQFATMSFAFYIVYALREFNMDEITAGYLTAAVTFAQAAANVVMGWLGDRIGHLRVMIFGMLAGVASSLLAWMAPSLDWFYAVFLISGLANVSYWTIGMAFVTHFSGEKERPMYIGISNTLVAPATIFAPVLGGWIATGFGYQMTFLLSGLIGVATLGILVFLVKDPRKLAAA